MSEASTTLVPPVVVTVTLTAPVSAGEVAVIAVADVTVKLTAVAPNLTDVAPVRLTPVIVTLVPPLWGPVGGARELTPGAGTAGVR